MNGYKVDYLNERGYAAFTWFGQPIYSDNFAGYSDEDMVVMMFACAHPEHDLISVRECTYEEYERIRKFWGLE